MKRALAATTLLLALVSPAAAQSSHLLVIVGLGGGPDNADLFHRWASTLVDAARNRWGLPAQSVVYLGEDPARDPVHVAGRATREAIDTAITRLAARARPGDRVFVVLFGHGSSADGEPRFNLPGPDLAAKDFAKLFDRFRAQVLIFVNTASGSGPFVAAISSRDRAVIAATRTEGERNQTRFGEFFVEALTTPDSDSDKDGRVSVLEAFSWARQRVVDSYKQDGQLQTEHPMLDDNGDGQGTDAPGQPGADGALSRTLFLGAGTSTGGPDAHADPALRALYDERKVIEERIALLKTARDGMDASQYERDMEWA